MSGTATVEEKKQKRAERLRKRRELLLREMRKDVLTFRKILRGRANVKLA